MMSMHYSIALMPALIICGLLFAVLIPALFAWLIIRLFGRKSSSGLGQEEMRTVQEVYRALSEMEKRIEALETILLERTRER